MIKYAHVRVEEGGDVLIILPSSRMSPVDEIVVWILDGELRIAQNNRTFVKIAVSEDDEVCILGAPEIIVAETDEVGFVIFQKVRRAQ